MLDDCDPAGRSAARVRVACSTSNLGPGFDLAGLALSLFLDVEVERVAGANFEFGELSGTATAWPREPERNKLVRAFERASKELDGASGGWRFRARSEIPVGRGLGSSGAATAAGLLLAAALSPRPTSREALLALGLELEGHPDNITPALFGGLTFTVPRSFGPPVFVRGKWSESLGFAAAWPASEFETRIARGLLPATVPFADAVENARRLALLIAGLESGDPELLALGGEDRLHVPYRLDALPGARAGLAAAREAGAWLATISGAGSALFAIGARDRATVIATAMRDALIAATGAGEGRALEVVREAPRPEFVAR
ncbi:MAG: homoserine kinase [Planctomycetes bacterium]|nr:homoserine kinase [Planctomycetota bacterium]